MMADDLRVSAPGPEGNGFSLDLTQRKLGLTGPNVALMLLIIGILYVAWDRSGKLKDIVGTGHVQMLEAEARLTHLLQEAEVRTHARVETLFARVNKLDDDLQAQNLLLGANNSKVIELLHAAQNHEDEGRQAQTKLVHEQTEAIRLLVEKVMTDIRDGQHEERAYTEAWFTTVGERMEIMNHNTLHPDRALPLRTTVRPDERQPERGGR
jgi:hypothetical protein